MSSSTLDAKSRQSRLGRGTFRFFRHPVAVLDRGGASPIPSFPSNIRLLLIGQGVPLLAGLLVEGPWRTFPEVSHRLRLSRRSPLPPVLVFPAVLREVTTFSCASPFPLSPRVQCSPTIDKSRSPFFFYDCVFGPPPGSRFDSVAGLLAPLVPHLPR